MITRIACTFAVFFGITLVTVAAAQDVQKVDIAGTEYALAPKEVRVKPGKVLFTLVNKGERAHDFRISGNGVEAKTDKFEKGTSGTLEVTLPAGEYAIYCGQGQHRARGMEGKLIVAP